MSSAAEERFFSDELSASSFGCGNDLVEALVTAQRIPARLRSAGQKTSNTELRAATELGISIRLATEKSSTPPTVSPKKSDLNSRRLPRGQFLKARIVADLIPHRVEPQKRRSERKATRYLQQPFENGNRVIGIP
jgi:hypothetical protein